MPSDRFWSLVGSGGSLPLPPGLGPCWLWKGHVGPNGYGYAGKGKLAHRVVYEALVGPIPDGLDLDHLCRVRACVNPAHLEPVTRAENLWRGALARLTACPRGHPYDRIDHDQHRRSCSICKRAKDQRWRARRRAA
jgi:hypothetical protein